MCIYSREAEDKIEVSKDEFDFSVWIDEGGLDDYIGWMSETNGFQNANRRSPDLQEFQTNTWIRDLLDFRSILPILGSYTRGRTFFPIYQPERYDSVSAIPIISGGGNWTSPQDAKYFADVIGRVYYWWNYQTFDKGKAKDILKRNNAEWVYWSKRNLGTFKLLPPHKVKKVNRKNLIGNNLVVLNLKK
jgi:hypothetical protein